jgi:hypothetical protein
MLTLFSPTIMRNCEGNSRREFLRIGTMGFGGLTLASLLAARARAGQYVTDKSVVVLFLQGGPTHIETFDPKMTAPKEYRAMFGEVQTRLPGVTFGSHFPLLAGLADKLAIVRSYRHGISSHAPASEHVISGGNPLKATMGTIYARVAGLTSLRTGIPNNAVLSPGAAGAQFKEYAAQTERVTSVGTLPPAYKAFDPSAGSQITDNMKLRIPQERLEDRRALLSGLDQLRRDLDATGNLRGADQFQQQAFDVILHGISQAFDLKQEDPRTLARYDTSSMQIPAAVIRKKRENVKRQQPVALGRQMLLARRLVEAGCGFVTVTSAGWDMHGNAFGIDDGMPVLGPAVDRAASAFIDDLHERGLSDKVLLVITGEFGRTPKINNKAGRDHWGNLCTLALSGGGLPMGQVIGASDRTASVPASDPVSSANVLATIMHTLFDVGRLRLESGIPTDIARFIAEGSPIAQLA